LVMAAAMPRSVVAADRKVVTMRDRLNETIIESVKFESASLQSTLEYLSARVEGLQFVILDEPDLSGIGAKPVTLALRKVPAATILSYLCRLTGCQYEVERDAVLVGKGDDIVAVMALREARPRGAKASAAMKKLHSVKLKSVELAEVDVTTALQYLRQLVADLSAETPPNFVIVEHQADTRVDPVAARLVTLKLKDVSALTAFGYLADLAKLGYRIDSRAIAVGPVDQIAFRPAHRLAGGRALQKQMATTQIAEVRLEGIALADALEGVRFYGRQGSSAELNVIDRARELADQPVINLQIDRLSLAELVHYIAEQSGTRVRIEQRALVFEKDPSLAQRAKAKQEKQAKALADSGGVAPSFPSPTSGSPERSTFPSFDGGDDQVSNGSGNDKPSGQGLKFDE
jgi:hypothetical protein